MKPTLLFLLLVTFAQTASAEEITIQKIGLPDKALFFRASESVLAKQPAWDPLIAAPTLPPDRAAQVAYKWLTKKYATIKAFSLESITLRHIDVAPVKNCWIYNLRFVPQPSGKEGPLGSWYHVVVLFDGTVIEPTITENP